MGQSRARSRTPWLSRLIRFGQAGRAVVEIALSRAVGRHGSDKGLSQVHLDSNGTYGAPRVRAELVLGRGVTVGHNAVAMLMRRAGLDGLPGSHRREAALLATVDAAPPL